MDWGPKLNMIEYGQATPPPYNLTTVTAPVILFWGDNDWLASPKVRFFFPYLSTIFTSSRNGSEGRRKGEMTSFRASSPSQKVIAVKTGSFGHCRDATKFTR